MITRNHSEWLKWIAVATMLIDHIGAILFPQTVILRMIGRISFPLFSFQIAVGVKQTSNLANYRNRLFYFAILSQLPYSLALDTTRLNVLVPFLLAVCLLSVRHWVKWGLLLLPLWIPMDYGWFGMLLVVCFYHFMNDRLIINVVSGLLMLLYTLQEWWIQILSVISLFIIGNHRFPTLKILLPKWVFYWFYPVHLFLLWLISLLR